MTQPSNQEMSVRTPGTIRTGIAAGALIAALALTGVGAAASDGGGVGSGGDGGGGGGGGKYDREWDSFSHKDKRWARLTSECESGGDPRIHSPGGTYHGAFQFSTSTWKASPMSPGGRHADSYNWKTQAVVAVKLMKKSGKQHWPNCGYH